LWILYVRARKRKDAHVSFYSRCDLVAKTPLYTL